MIEILKTFLANKINSFPFTTCKLSSIMVGYCYIYIKNPTLLYVTAVNIKKSHIFPYRYISELHTFSRLFIFILPSNVMLIASLILKQGVQGLQAFTFCILIINDEHTKQTQVQNKAQGLNIKKAYVPNCLKLQFESNGYFCNFTESGWF